MSRTGHSLAISFSQPVRVYIYKILRAVTRVACYEPIWFLRTNGNVNKFNDLEPNLRETLKRKKIKYILLIKYEYEIIY